MSSAYGYVRLFVKLLSLSFMVRLQEAYMDVVTKIIVTIRLIKNIINILVPIKIIVRCSLAHCNRFYI